jgi:hypothetical protein
MGITRMKVDNWTRLLNDHVEEYRFTPFEWGVHDCGTFAAAAFHLLTGIEPDYGVARPRSSLQSFLKHQLRDPDGLRGLTSKTLGFQPQSNRWQEAKRGDIVLIQSPRAQLVGLRQAMGVVLATTVAVPGPLGLAFINTSAAVQVWHVG